MVGIKCKMDYPESLAVTRFSRKIIVPTYLLLDQYLHYVQKYTKIGAKKWEFQEYDRLEDEVNFNSVSFAIALTEIYDKVELEQC